MLRGGPGHEGTRTGKTRGTYVSSLNISAHTGSPHAWCVAASSGRERAGAGAEMERSHLSRAVMALTVATH